jgi:antitoxin (DNA-binding transcriptional repressor) of toxin-antitoxin stability system
MKRIDLDDLPPKLAALLAQVEDGEEVILVRNGAVVGRLTGGSKAPSGPPASEAEPSPDAQEIFEQFRSMMEDEF